MRHCKTDSEAIKLYEKVEYLVEKYNISWTAAATRVGLNFHSTYNLKNRVNKLKREQHAKAKKRRK